ncbi:hypothetical protein PSAC2689_100321 [Paraburkholderia sacchari]
MHAKSGRQCRRSTLGSGDTHGTQCVARRRNLKRRPSACPMRRWDILSIVPGASDNTQICKMLEIMESSRECQSGELARRLDTSMAQINDVLRTLAEEGLVRMRHHSSRIICLERLFASKPPTPLVSDTATRAAVSTPPFAPQRHGRLRDYEASLLSVHSLAMLVRPSH